MRLTKYADVHRAVGDEFHGQSEHHWPLQRHGLSIVPPDPPEVGAVTMTVMGRVTCAVSDLTLGNTGDYTATRRRSQATSVWTPGHVIGEVATDSDSDPTLILTNLINNDTDFRLDRL